MIMSNSHFPLKIEANTIKLVGENDKFETMHTAVIEHTHSDTNGNGSLRVLLHTKECTLPLKLNNWIIEPIIEVSYDWGHYYFSIKLRDLDGDLVEVRDKTTFGTQSSRNFPQNYIQEILYTLNKVILMPDAKYWRASQRITPSVIETINQDDIVVIGGEYNEYIVRGLSIHQGNIYVLPTMYNEVFCMRPHIEDFVQYAKKNSENRFLVTKIGANNNCLCINQVAQLFESAIDIENIYLPKEFWSVLLKE